MAFTDIFIKRPVLATVVSLLILLIGAQAGFKLPIRQYPELSNTTITVMTSYPGANADLIQGFITVPIQQAVASAEGIDTLVATSTQNVSTVTLNLKLDADPDRAMTDVLSKIAQVKSILPREANNSVVTKQTGEGYALMYMSFNSDVMTSSQISDYLTRVVQPKLQTIDGVANAQILGGQVFAMRIWLDPDRMASLGVTPLDVRSGARRQQLHLGARPGEGRFRADQHRRQDLARRSERLQGARRDGARGFARAPRRHRRDRARAAKRQFLVRVRRVEGRVHRRLRHAHGQSADRHHRRARGLPARSRRSCLPGLTAAIAYDATNFIRASLWEVMKTMGEAAIIVIVVIFLFLGNFRSTFIPLVTIPLSLIGVLAALMALGYSINLMTLLALVLAIGLVVDDAIVVVENIYRHIEEGQAAATRPRCSARARSSIRSSP